MSWLEKLLPKAFVNHVKKNTVPDGIWTKCEHCKTVIYTADFKRNLNVCIRCNYHAKLKASERLNSFLDQTPRTIIADSIVSRDRLNFVDTHKYTHRIKEAQKKTSQKEAFIGCIGELFGIQLVVAAFEFDFMGGSMGSAVGERFKACIDVCLEKTIPFVCFVASGGARMQEGLFSLMQMSKTSAAIAKLAEKKLPYITVLTNPTMGGVSASLAMLGDVIIAEPMALIGFAGPRVIEQIVKGVLPEGFQRTEFLLKHGAIDMVCDRRELRETIFGIIKKLTIIK